MDLKKLAVIVFNAFLFIYSPIALICEFSQFLPSILLENASSTVIGPNPAFYLIICALEGLIIGVFPGALLFPYNDSWHKL
jgi:hypothetical protein